MRPAVRALLASRPNETRLTPGLDEIINPPVAPDHLWNVDTVSGVADGGTISTISNLGAVGGPAGEDLGQASAYTLPTLVKSSAAFGGHSVADLDASANANEGSALQTTFATAITQPSTRIVVFQAYQAPDGVHGIVVDGFATGRTAFFWSVTDGNVWALTAGTQVFGSAADTNPHVAVIVTGTTDTVYNKTFTSLVSGDAGAASMTGATWGINILGLTPGYDYIAHDEIYQGDWSATEYLAFRVQQLRSYYSI